MTPHQRAIITLQQRQELRQKAKELRAQRVADSKPQKYAALRYDYATIDEDKRELVQAAAVEILALRKRAATDMIDIGKRLLETKAMMAHGKFQDWLEIEFDLTLRMAQHFMSAARRFGGAELSDIGTKLVALLESKSEQSSFLGPSVIRLLAAKSVPDSAIEEVLAIAETQDEPVSVEQTKGIIDEHKAMLPAKRGALGAKPKQLPPPPEPATIEAEYTVAPPLMTFADWLAAMPTDLTVGEHLAILELAKGSASKLRNLRPSLYNAVSNAIPTWSVLIIAVEKELK